MECDNKFGNVCKCPARMSDGRLLTNYVDNLKLNESMKMVNNIKNEYDYRMFLQKNGSVIIKNELKHLETTRSCNCPK